MGIQLVAKLDSAARGGKTFPPCMMWENSLRLTAAQRQKDLKRSRKLLNLRDAADKRACRPGNDRYRNRNRDDTKSKRQLRHDHEQKWLDSAPANAKSGEIIGDGYLKCRDINSRVGR